jgi:CheY-like chemotaxis protein
MEDQNDKSKKILVVDDDPGILEWCSEVLTDAGFNVDTASNGNEALQKAELENYAIILLDIMMNEGINGMECLKVLKSDPAKYKKPIVIMLTNYAITNNVKEAFDNGAEGYLIKLTLSNDQLVKKVKGFLHGFSN